MYSASNSIALASGLGNSIEKFSQFQNRLLCSPLLLRRSYHAFYFFIPAMTVSFWSLLREFSFKDNSKNSVYNKSWFCFNGFALVIAGSTLTNCDSQTPLVYQPKKHCRWCCEKVRQKKRKFGWYICSSRLTAEIRRQLWSVSWIWNWLVVSIEVYPFKVLIYPNKFRGSDWMGNIT